MDLNCGTNTSGDLDMSTPLIGSNAPPLTSEFKRYRSLLTGYELTLKNLSEKEGHLLESCAHVHQKNQSQKQQQNDKEIQQKDKEIYSTEIMCTLAQCEVAQQLLEELDLEESVPGQLWDDEAWAAFAFELFSLAGWRKLAAQLFKAGGDHVEKSQAVRRHPCTIP